jgi:hypothetical protein
MTIGIRSTVRLSEAAKAANVNHRLDGLTGTVVDLNHVRPEGADLTHSDTVPVACVDWKAGSHSSRSHHKLADLQPAEGPC